MKVKKASPADVKKAFGVQSARVLEVIDSHADCLEGLIAQVEYLTVQNKQKSDQIDALLDGMAQLQQRVNPQAKSAARLVGPDGRIM